MQKLKKIVIIPSNHAYTEAAKYMNSLEHGLMRKNKSNGSEYWGRRGSPHSIRIANHESVKKAAVVVDLVFNYNTIQSDIVVRIGTALKEYNHFLEQKNKKA